MHSVAISLSSALLLVGCAEAEVVLRDARALERVAPELDRSLRAVRDASGTHLGEEIAGISREVKVSKGIKASADAAKVSEWREKAEEIEATILWSAACDLLAGKLPREKSDVARYISTKALAYGLELVADEDSKLASGVLEAIQSNGQTSVRPSTCDALKGF